ncbi:hypothetical protein R6Q59_010345 [Mikania micrantha]
MLPFQIGENPQRSFCSSHTTTCTTRLGFEEVAQEHEGLLLDFYSDPEKAKHDKITISEVVSSILKWFSLTLVVAGNYFSLAGSCNFDFHMSSWKRKPNEEILILSLKSTAMTTLTGRLPLGSSISTNENETDLPRLLNFNSDPENAKCDKITFLEIVATLTFILADGSKKPNEEILFEFLCDLWDADAKKDATYVEVKFFNTKMRLLH